MNEERFNEPFDDQDWLDIGADLRIKIRQEFNRIKKLKDQALAEKDQRIKQLEDALRVATKELKGTRLEIAQEALSQKGGKDE